MVCCGVVCVVCTCKSTFTEYCCTQLQTEVYTYIYIYICVCVCVCEYKHSYCTHFNMVTIEGIMKVMKEDVHKLCTFHSEQFKLKKSSLEGQLLLLQLNSLHRLLRV